MNKGRGSFPRPIRGRREMCCKTKGLYNAASQIFVAFGGASR